MKPNKLKRIIDILSEDDVKGISKQDIKEWEDLHSYAMTVDPEYRRKFINGKIKANIVDGKLKMGIFDDGYNTPREAEHFTEGYGEEPMRGSFFNRTWSRLVKPYGQH